MPQDLGILNYNLPALYHFAQSDSKDTLVANLAGTHIYSTSRGWGKVWKILYAVIGFFCGHSLKEKKLQQALMKTHTVFQEQLTFVKEYVAKYQTYLEESFAGYNPRSRVIPEEDYFEIGHVISDWNDTTLDFSHLIRRNQHTAINDLFRKHVGAENLDVAKLFHSDVMQKCIHFQRILNLEFQLDAKLPLRALSEITQDIKLYKEPIKEVRTMVKNVNKNAEKIGIRLFHRTLRYLMQYIPDKSKYEKNLARLETDLVKEELGGCAIFDQLDAEHIKWRQTFTEGSKLAINSKYNGKYTVELGEQIGKKNDDQDKNIFFSIKGNPDQVVWISLNESVLLHKWWGRSEYELRYKKNGTQVLQPVMFYDLDKSGRVAIMERLKTPLDFTTWISDGTLSWQDESRCEDICNVISNFIAMNMTPFPLSPKYLMLDANNQIKSTKILFTDPTYPFNFNALEDLVIEYSNKNPWVFKHIMVKSKLEEHEYSKYYRRVAKYAAEGEQMSSDELSTYKGIKDHRVVDRGRELHAAVTGMMAEICAKLQAEHGHKKDTVTEKFVGNAINKHYIGTGCVSVLWPSLSDEVYADVCQQLKLSK